MEQGISGLLGNRIRAMRQCRKLSVAYVARLTGCAPQKLLRYERGDIRMNVDMLYQLSCVFQCSVDDFFEGVPSE